MESKDEIAALRLVSSLGRGANHGLTERGHAIINRHIQSLLRQGLVDFDRTRAYKLTPKGKALI